MAWRKKIIYIPWRLEDSLSEFHECRNWRKRHSYYHTVNYTGQRNQFVGRLNPFDEIYIIGHGQRGIAAISSDKGDVLNVSEIVDRLETSGLPKLFMGAVKVWA